MDKKSVGKSDINSRKLVILKVLIKEKYPIFIDEMRSKCSANRVYMSRPELNEALKSLQLEGYDIKRIKIGSKEKITLVRFGSFTSKSFYKVLGEIKLPMIITSDWHIASKTYSPMALEEMVKDCTKHKIKSIVHAGDLIQGLGIYSIEAADILETSIDGQVEMAIGEIMKFPKQVKFYSVIGNHEEKIKSEYRKGHDPIRAISSGLSSLGRDNFEYYGHMAKFMIDGKYPMLVLHGTGKPTYAWTYRAQQILRNLTEKPQFLVTGHLHQCGVWGYPTNNYAISAGTLQRENAYLLQSGIQSMVSWVIIHSFDGKSINYSIRTPEIF